MISVIVPTMWRFEPFLDFVNDLIKCDIIDDFIIINNDNTRTPVHPVLQNPKVKMLDFGRNIFVNPAWNEGVKIAKNSKICIINDDLIFDMRLLYKVYDMITTELGVIGITRGAVEFGQTPFTNGLIGFELFTGQNCFGFGEIMFMHKDHWKDIPEGLDISFGDIFIFERALFRGLPIYFANNLMMHHEGSLTQKEIPRPEAEATLERENAIYQVVRQRLLSNDVS